VVEGAATTMTMVLVTLQPMIRQDQPPAHQVRVIGKLQCARYNE